MRVFCLFLLALDIVSKIVAIKYVPAITSAQYPFGGLPIFSLAGVTFSLNYTVNTGAAWGLFSGYPGILFVFRTLIIASLAFFAAKGRSMWLIITGAIGNVVDYCCYGHVVDFFHFTFWGYSFPIFNVADSCIVIGVFSLLLFSREARPA
jgi:signal peptidase II